LKPSDPRGLTDDETKIIYGHKMLTLLRNRHAHPLEAIAAGKYTWNKVSLISLYHQFTNSSVASLKKDNSVVSLSIYFLWQIVLA